jgi:hypothetical protein
MSDIPDQPPLVSAVKARNVARLYKGLADALRADGITAQANAADRQSQWWMTYAIALSQIPPGRVDMDGAP